MEIKTTLPHTIREIENTFITLADGAKLAARIWLPEDAEQNPVPAILEYVPYRKNDTLAHRDSIMHPYVAGHGYACVRVDVRGSGDSDGILFDEYLPQELSDGAEVIAWLAAQKWCAGSVGLLGKSWGGFNGLQIAALRPPALKAVISVCSTDDRYADDVHYVGGCVLGSEMLSWASTMLAYNAKPPDPRFVGERWREMWLDRMERTPPYVEAWLTHQRRDSFWKHGSVCEPGRFVTGRFVTGRFVTGRFVNRPYNRPYGDITCPVYAIGGWADGYTNAIPRMLAGLSCPRKGLIGPWAHIYPHEGAPGPLIGFNQECLRWWDTWLKGIDTGIMREPMLRAWMQEAVEPKTFYAVRPGRWVAENEWPPRRDVAAKRLYLNNGTLESVPLQETQIDFAGSQTCGLESGVWCPYGLPGDMPPDQRGEDGLSLCFDSAPLAERVEILGFPEVTLALTADQPNALVAVRLCDVSPTGTSARVSWGVLNLTHRHSHEHPTPLEPGKR
ncbi:MAG: CocE/NonD family hydrolase, partial [Chloroflexota bacterium]